MNRRQLFTGLAGAAAAVVIADVGCTHDRRAEKALRLIDAAAAAGANAVKFRFYSDAERVAARRGVPLSVRELYRRYRIPEYWLAFLSDACRAAGIEFVCSTALPDDVETVAPFVQRFAIASVDADARDLIDAHRPYWKDREVLIGTVTAPDLTWCEDDPTIGRVRFLHCISAAAGLSARELESFRFLAAGVADRSRHSWMGALVVAAGAKTIQAPLRLDDTDPQNPEYAAAFSPPEFTAYVENIRFAEQAMGDGVKTRQPYERELA
jgi:N,N'-diacetyllegionaminate synthase